MIGGLGNCAFCTRSSAHLLPSPSITNPTYAAMDRLVQRFICPSLNTTALVLESLSFSALHFNLPRLKPAYIVMLNLLSKSIIFSKHQLCLENNPKLLEADLKFSILEGGMALGYLSLLKVIHRLEQIPVQEVQSSVWNTLDRTWTPLIQTAFTLTHLFIVAMRYRARR